MLAMASQNSLSLLVFHVTCLLVLLEATTTLIVANSSSIVGENSSNVSCIEEERNALLEFKQGLTDPYSQLDSWVGDDCCKWQGIDCNESTGNVLGLSLSNTEILSPFLMSLENLSHLEYLDLSMNSISGPIPASIGNLSHLEILSLSDNSISGPIPASIGSLPRLRTLDLSRNSFSGPLPTSIGNLSHLEDLILSYNPKLNGPIPQVIGQLTELTKLDLTFCSWEGFISEKHFQNLAKLKWLGISNQVSKPFVFNVSDDWIPIFNLTYLEISDCRRLNPAFPTWLRTQQFLESITLSNFGISDTIPYWLWRDFQFLGYLQLSNNQLRGKLPNSINPYLSRVNLDNNSLVGSLPLWPNVELLSLASNRFSGPIPLNIGHEMSELFGLRLSSNNLNGSIPHFNNMKSLLLLDLSRNHLSGKIPEGWAGTRALRVLDLSRNNLSGQIPSSICTQLSSIDWLRLSKNNLSGDVETSLQNCNSLSTLDLTGNRFSGTMSKWIGENLHRLSSLLLRDNKFTGNISQEICGLPYLRVLDLSINSLSGSIPRCLSNLTEMTEASNMLIPKPDFYFFEMEIPKQMELIFKGVEIEFTDNSRLLSMLDLSSNNLRGEIPEQIRNLMALSSLNLSHNQLTGKIPEGIGNLKKLEALDLSGNHLWGSIPSSMTHMTSLGYLNLSHNNLSGSIPSTNQFFTFNDPTSFEGNSGLCGGPLPTRCGSVSNHDQDREVEEEEDEEDKYGRLWLYASTTIGFIVGFWVVFGSLVIKRSWRHAYFRFLDKIKYRLSFW